MLDGDAVKQQDAEEEGSTQSAGNLQGEVLVFPASFAQQRLWLLDQLEPNNAAYNIPLFRRVRGPLGIAALQQCLGEIVRRHESLRTTFTLMDEDPVQVIDLKQDVPLPLIDLSELPAAEREAAVQRIALEEANRPFDLAQGPLFRAGLLRLGEREHVLMLNMHHVVSDGWSIGVLFHEISALYDAFHAGEPSPLPELGIQYADYAVWQREHLTSEVLEAQLSYWKQQLAGVDTLNLPTDRPRPARQTFNGARHSFQLDAKLTQQLSAQSQANGTTLFMTLLAAFQVLLSRYSGQHDIAVGTPVAGRTRSELEPLIGFFVNTLVLRTDLSGDPRFTEVLSRVREVSLGSYAHQEVPFEKLVEALQPGRDLSRSPLFQVMFTMQPEQGSGLELAGLELTRLSFRAEKAKFDLSLAMHRVGDEIAGGFDYNTDLFDASTIERMAGHFERLLEAALAAPDEPISRLPLLTPDETAQLLRHFNDTEISFPEEACIHGLILEQASRTPNAPALLSAEGTEQLTYAELARRVRALAYQLRSRGVGPGTLVGLYAQRSPSMVVGLLGILAAGGGYVPLDATYPEDRLGWMVEDSGLALVVSDSSLAASVSGLGAGLEVVLVEESVEEAGKAEEALAGSGVTSRDVAYVIYTSGSTGRPKGVVVEHRCVVNFLGAMRQEPGMAAQDTLLAVTTLSFDIAALELLLPLTVGARVVIVRSDVAADGNRLAALIGQATVLQATPATWRLLLEAGWKGNGALKMLCGGEPLPRALAVELLPLGASLWNLYGPTEATIWSTVQQVLPARVGLEEGGAVSIGRPIANTQLYVLDAQRQLVPVGVAGELYISGAGLARGYLNRPELTAERFVESPFGEGRLYRTGDLVRWRSDGSLVFLGRTDYQVKVRGFRIELGEVEAVLMQHPGVREAVVIDWDEGSGGKSLVAYVSVTEEVTAPGETLRGYLADRLPEYMIPGVWMEVEALPRLPNGKLDRRSLPTPVRTRQAEALMVAPSTDVEKMLAAIWEDVLEVEAVGVYDNFFDLGGHSLLAMRVIARIEEQLGVQVRPMEMILQSLGQLAAACEERIALTPARALEQPTPAPEAEGMVQKLFKFIKKVPSRS